MQRHVPQDSRILVEPSHGIPPTGSYLTEPDFYGDYVMWGVRHANSTTTTGSTARYLRVPVSTPERTPTEKREYIQSRLDLVDYIVMDDFYLQLYQHLPDEEHAVVKRLLRQLFSGELGFDLMQDLQGLSVALRRDDQRRRRGAVVPDERPSARLHLQAPSAALTVRMQTRTLRKTAFLVAFNLVVSIALLEGLFLLLLHTPRLTAASPAPVRRLIQQVYRHFNRSLIQFDPDCARYDPEVTYTLKPGSCSFGNIEFTNGYRINHLGLRDSDAALDAPEIIVLGDSHAMGWGVEQDQAFPKVVEQRTGLKTLNAAVSSYATVREMRMLGRLDTSRLRYLVVQHADNDLPENRAFKENGNELPITAEDKYQEIVRYYAAQQRYIPGKYLYRLVMKVLRLEPPEPDQLKMEPIAPADEARLFLNALEHAGGASEASLAHVQVIVLEIGQEFAHPKAFVAAVAEESRRDGHPPFVQLLLTFDTTSVLKPG